MMHASFSALEIRVDFPVRNSGFTTGFSQLRRWGNDAYIWFTNVFRSDRTEMATCYLYVASLVSPELYSSW